MDLIDALILGLVQGLAEYLPISSSGHLEICREVLGLQLAGAEALEFDTALHVATVLSTIVVLWRKFVPLCVSFFTWRRDDNFSYVCKILVSCIPVAIVGVFFKDTVESFFGGSLTLVGCCLLVTAALLSFAYFFRTRPTLEQAVADGSSKDPGHGVRWIDAVAMGIAQSIAVLPGLSRSGTTIATGISMGARRSAVAEFSFFMVIIPILGEALLNVMDMASGESAVINTIGWLPLTVGFVASFVSGCAACKWMIEIVKRGKLVWFAVYCVAMGLVCILW